MKQSCLRNNWMNNESYILNLLTLNWHPALWWQLSWVLTLVETFVWLRHRRDVQLPSAVILDKFVIVIEKHPGQIILFSQSAAQTDRSSKCDWKDRAHQDNICICKTIQIKFPSDNIWDVTQARLSCNLLKMVLRNSSPGFLKIFSKFFFGHWQLFHSFSVQFLSGSFSAKYVFLFVNQRMNQCSAIHTKTYSELKFRNSRSP